MPKSIGWMCISMACRSRHKTWVKSDEYQGQSRSQAIHQVVDWAVWVSRCPLFGCGPLLLGPWCHGS